LGFLWANIADAQILLPKDPTPVEAPQTTIEQYEKDIEIKRQIRTQRLDKKQIEKNKQSEVIKENQIIQDTLKPRLRKYLLEVSLISPAVITNGDRKDYTSNLTSHFNLFLRNNPKSSDDKMGLWYGFRMAPFSGSGRYKNFSGNYGFTYFGPMIGLGTIESMPAEPSKAKNGLKANPPAISGWVVTGGLALQHRLDGADPSDKDEVDDEFNDNLGFDSPGLWIEYRYLRIVWGAVATNFIAGVQTGQQKIFTYAGLGFGGWH